MITHTHIRAMIALALLTSTAALAIPPTGTVYRVVQTDTNGYPVVPLIITNAADTIARALASDALDIVGVTTSAVAALQTRTSAWDRAVSDAAAATGAIPRIVALEGGTGTWATVTGKVAQTDASYTSTVALAAAAYPSSNPSGYVDRAGATQGLQIAGAYLTAETDPVFAGWTNGGFGGVATNYDTAGAADIVQSNLTSHVTNIVPHVSAVDRTNWDGKTTLADVAGVGYLTSELWPTDRDAVLGHTTSAHGVSPNGGFAGGGNSSAGGGGAVGFYAVAGEGGAMGAYAMASYGGAMGAYAMAGQGGAVGQGSSAGSGFSGGLNARSAFNGTDLIDAIQLGAGQNPLPGSLGVYGYTLMSANGEIPLERTPALVSTNDARYLAGLTNAAAFDAAGAAAAVQTNAVDPAARAGVESNANAAVTCPTGPRTASWFKITVQSVLISLPDINVNVTNLDLVTSVRTYGRTRPNKLVGVEILRGAPTNPICFSVAPTNLALIDSNGYLAVLSDGTCSVTVAVGNLTRAVDMVLTSAYTVAQTLVGGATGSLRADVTTAVDARLFTNAVDTSMQMYTVMDHSATNYLRNTNCWVYDYDLTCVPVWNSCLNSPATGGTLISPRHVLYANHFRPPLGTVIRWVTSSNTVVQRTLASTETIGDSGGFFSDTYTDICIGTLDADISPNDIRFARVLPTAYAAALPTDIAGLPILAPNQVGQATVSEGHYTGAYVTMSPPTLYSRTLYYKLPIGGDSGQPRFLLCSGQAVLLGAAFFPFSASFVSAHSAVINAVMSPVGGYQLTPISLQPFATY